MPNDFICAMLICHWSYVINWYLLTSITLICVFGFPERMVCDDNDILTRLNYTDFVNELS